MTQQVAMECVVFSALLQGHEGAHAACGQKSDFKSNIPVLGSLGYTEEVEWNLRTRDMLGTI